MNNYTISETFTLPSKGKIYSKEVSPTVTLRSMTTQDEMIRLSPSEDAFLPMCNLIDSCMVNNPGISSYDMCIGDYLFLLHKLRIITYGSDYTMSCLCPYCGCNHEASIDLNELEIIEFNEEDLKYMEFTLPVTGKTIKIRHQTPRMIDRMQAKEKEFKRKHKNMANDYTIVFTLTSLIEEVDNKKVDALILEEFVKTLPMKDTNMILQHAAKLNSTIGIDTELIVNCDVCGLDFTTKLQMNSEFFRPALDI